MHTCQQRTRCGGFALTEASVVLGVVGLVLASIWTTAGMVIQNQKTSQFSQQLTTLVTNVSKMYEGKRDFASSAEEARQFEQTLIAAGAVPSAMITDSTTPPGLQTPFGKGFRITTTVTGDVGKVLYLNASRMDTSECVSMVKSSQAIPTNIAIVFFDNYYVAEPCTMRDYQDGFCEEGQAYHESTFVERAVNGIAASGIVSYCENQKTHALDIGLLMRFR